MTFDLTTLSDGELAALSLVGRQTAYAEIMRRHGPPVFRLVRGYIGDADEALDLSQDTFIAAHQALRRYDQSRPMRTWLLAIALNKCRDWGRKRVVRRFLSFAGPIDAKAENVADEEPRIDDAAADRQALDRVSRAIAGLPVNLKEPLILRTIEGLSQTETAGILSISEKAVETRLYRARAKLKDKLNGG
ncbi:MAG: RNA polymerase sigma factor [Sphingomonas sp.]